MFGLLIGFACLYNFLEYTGIGIALLAYLNLGIYTVKKTYEVNELKLKLLRRWYYSCLLYTSDAADERSSVDLGGRRIIKKKNIEKRSRCCISDKHI